MFMGSSRKNGLEGIIRPLAQTGRCRKSFALLPLFHRRNDGVLFLAPKLQLLLPATTNTHLREA
jgi:hypothetical protein